MNYSKSATGIILLLVLQITSTAQNNQHTDTSFTSTGNPIITHKYTADPVK